MNSLPISILPIGLIIIALALTPWIQLFFQSTEDKKAQKVAFRGAITTLSIVVTVFTLLLLMTHVIGEYSIYLMMLDLIFGSWLGYALTQTAIQDNIFGPFVTRKNELLDE